MTGFAIKLARADQVGEAVGVLCRAFEAAGLHDTDRHAEAYYLSSLFNRESGLFQNARPLAFLVAVDEDDHIVGTVACTAWKPWFSGSPCNNYWLTSLSVAPERQKQGIGGALLAGMERHIETELLQGRRGTARLADSTKRTDPESNFYESRGYKPYGTWRGMATLWKYLNANPA